MKIIVWNTSLPQIYVKSDIVTWRELQVVEMRTIHLNFSQDWRHDCRYWMMVRAISNIMWKAWILVEGHVDVKDDEGSVGKFRG